MSLCLQIFFYRLKNILAPDYLKKARLSRLFRSLNITHRPNPLILKHFLKLTCKLRYVIYTAIF